MAKAPLTADAPTSDELAQNLQLIERIEQALIIEGHQPKRIGNLIHHIGDRYTGIWVMPVMRNTKVVVGKFVLRIGRCDIIKELPDPHGTTLDDIVDWIENWLNTTTEPVIEPATNDEGELFDDGTDVES